MSILKQFRGVVKGWQLACGWFAGNKSLAMHRLVGESLPSLLHFWQRNLEWVLSKYFLNIKPDNPLKWIISRLLSLFLFLFYHFHIFIYIWVGQHHPLMSPWGKSTWTLNNDWECTSGCIVYIYFSSH